MAKKKTSVPREVGLEHVEAALDQVMQDLADIRTIVAAMRKQRIPTIQLDVNMDPGTPCVRGPGNLGQRDLGRPCRK
jgi:hypothetical protein